jgi:hypothetical protein
VQVFKQNGVEQYNPVGQKFDPNLHNALFEVPDAEKEAGTVAVVTKVGGAGVRGQVVTSPVGGWDRCRWS